MRNLRMSTKKKKSEKSKMAAKMAACETNELKIEAIRL